MNEQVAEIGELLWEGGAGLWGMFNGHCFDTRTVVKFVNKILFPKTDEVAAAAGEAAGTGGLVQNCSIKFQEEWPWVRAALMDLVCEIDGARDLFLKLLIDLKPWMTAPEWAVSG